MFIVFKQWRSFSKLSGVGLEENRKAPATKKGELKKLCSVIYSEQKERLSARVVYTPSPLICGCSSAGRAHDF